MSTVILKQYTKTSKEGGFYGQLPTTLIDSSIENESYRAFIKKFLNEKIPHDQFYERFLSETEIGKCHNRRMQLFGLRTTSLTPEFVS